MKIDTNTTKLIAELEYIIGNSCFNPNSYDGYTGEEGRSFRYPVYKLNDKYYSKLSKLQPNEVNTVKYKFGSNHLFIGKGLVNVLNVLEERYNINFNELESIRNETEE